MVKPLTYAQLLKYIKNDHSLEEELHLQQTSRKISPALQEALAQTILPAVADPTKDYLYATLWTAIDKAQQKMVGDLCIVGEPNAAGEIEIGYGTYDEFRNQGYMSEMVSAIISWAANQPKVKAIIASTEKTNVASSKVLERNKFQKTAESETLFMWKLNVHPT